MTQHAYTVVAPLRRATLLCALIGVAAAASACSDPYAMKAQYTNATQIFVVHALSGSALNFSSALSLPAKATTKVDGSFSFDVAFDLNAKGDVVFLPPHTVGENPLGNRQVGIQKATTTYDLVTLAPTAGYTYDSVTVAKRGETVIVQAPSTTCSLYALPYLYAKVVVDSIDPTTRTLYGRTMINSNCTFRSLEAGLPTK